MENTPEAVLKLERRRRIFQLIRKQPGIPVTELGKALGLSGGVLHLHLRRLYSAGLVVARDTGAHTRLYLAHEAPPQETRPWPSEAAKAVAFALLERPGRSANELADEMGLTSRAVRGHLHALGEEGWVAEERSEADRRIFIYFPTPALHRRIAKHESDHA